MKAEWMDVDVVRCTSKCVESIIYASRYFVELASMARRVFESPRRDVGI